MTTQDERILKRDFFEALIYTGYEPSRESSIDHDEDRSFRRYTQDSPVMPDVWIHFGLDPFKRHDLLLTPVNDRSPGKLAALLKDRLEKVHKSKYHRDFKKNLLECKNGRLVEPKIAYNQTTVVARLWFHELIQAALPLTSWWTEQLSKDRKPKNHPTILISKKVSREKLRRDLNRALSDIAYDAQRGLVTTNLVWMARVVGTIALVTDLKSCARGLVVTKEDLEERRNDPEALTKALFELLDGVDTDEHPSAHLFSVNRNRKSLMAMYRSVPAVKADAVQQLFDVRGFDITWAVLDGGIDATHWAFRNRDTNGLPEEEAFKKPKRIGGGWKNQTRIKRTYDFTRFRELMSGDGDPEIVGLIPEEVRNEFARSLQTGRMIDWEILEPALRIDHDDEYENHHIPKSHHGTHVAGILAADWRAEDDDDDMLPFSSVRDGRPSFRSGVCPEISLYDFRVVDEDGVGYEFNIMAALQFVRSLNARRDYVEIHGVNMSLSLTHEVSNYACGRTPVCNECERLVGAGIVVVASAGNQGRRRFLTREGDEETYSSISITDPGNADTVITVGATHSREPHTYGVSYFSSRGPTGDGRLKPDLVAPGEKVCSTIPNNREEYLDGTSMAAPHVSGAAALLMCRNPELIGNPLRIKKILCETATDLGRERYFQGSGLLDVLRAMQSI